MKEEELQRSSENDASFSEEEEVFSKTIAEDLTPEEYRRLGFEVAGGILQKYIGKGGDVTIPVGVKELGANAFKGNRTVTSVVVSRGVTAIGEECFSGCSALVSVTVAEGVTEIIGGYAWDQNTGAYTVHCSDDAPDTTIML